MCWRDDVIEARVCSACNQEYYGDLGHRNCPAFSSKPSLEEHVKKSSDSCVRCGHPRYDHDDLGCIWRRHGAVRMCQCDGFIELLKTKEEIRTGIWQHFKSSEMKYIVLFVSTGTEDGINKKIYIPLYGEHAGKICDRPLSMFLEEVNRPEFNYNGPRFFYTGPV